MDHLFRRGPSRRSSVAHATQRLGGTMAKLVIEQRHTLAPEVARQRLEELSGRLSAQYGIESRWLSPVEAEIKRTGVSGKIQCSDGVVQVTLDLSFALLPV